MTICLSFLLSEYYWNNCFIHKYSFENITIIMFGNLLGINPMGLSASLPTIKTAIPHKHENFTRIINIIHIKKGYTQWAFVTLGPTLSFTTEKLSKHIQQEKIRLFCWKYFYHSQNNCEVLNQWASIPFGTNLKPTQLQTWITWITALNPINVLIVTGEITKTGILTTTFHKPVGGANPYVQFWYGPLKICNHTLWQVSVPMNANPINMIHTSQ